MNLPRILTSAGNPAVVPGSRCGAVVLASGSWDGANSSLHMLGAIAISAVSALMHRGKVKKGSARASTSICRLSLTEGFAAMG